MNSKKTNLVALLCLMTFVFAINPESAHAAGNPISEGVDWLMDLLTTGIARSCAIIGLAAVGYMAWAGKMTMEKCGMIIFGIVCVFGGASIVDLIIAAVS